MNKDRMKELLKIEQQFYILKEAHDHYREASAKANHYILQHELNKLNYNKQLDKILAFIETKKGILDMATLGVIADYIKILEQEKEDNGYCNSRTYYQSL